MSFPYTPTADNIVLQRITEEKSRSGALFIPSAAAENENRATVVAVGPLVSDHAIEVGAEVLIEKYDGKKVKLDNQEYYVFPEADILGIRNQE